MEVFDPNNVKIYNLSAGKSLPEWLSDRKRRALQKKDVDIRRRIELIQDFNMPGVSTNVKVSPDGQFILATGIYKPRVKCYDVNHLSMKFERCLDSEVVTFQILSEDYSKLVFLQCDRYIEFHSAPGYYYRLRIPKFGRDLKYHPPTSELFIVGASSDIYRLNLERGQFLMSYLSNASEINKCAISPVHQILMCGTKEGKVEAWDPRDRSKIGELDCALHCTNDGGLDGFPSVTSINFQNGLVMAVGTATGQILLYDIRSNKPFFVKDHMYGLPIKKIDFENNQNYVLSMDSSVIKIWERDTGKIFTSIEGKSDFNDLCFLKNTGMMFVANENTKILTYYIPSLGPAPRWCGFLDSLTEELEESKKNTMYDDYKFVTKKELAELGLSHLLGTALLRAYMHGYFIDIRLYKKAKSLADPFAFDKYRKQKIREKIEQDRQNRVKVSKLPTVNRDLALKLMDDPKKQSSLLQDERFSGLFKNPEFEIDETAEEYRLVHPVLSRMEKKKKKEREKLLKETFEEVKNGDEPEGKNSSEESSSDDDENEASVRAEMRKQYAIIKRERRQKEIEERKAEPRFYELKEGEDYRGIGYLKKKVDRAALGDRVAAEERQRITVRGRGNREMKFSVAREKREGKFDVKIQRHHQERKLIHRSAMGLLRKERPRFWKGKRVT
ncbi:hypothetical protein RUM43_008225 [Polyplax serrata]|uniref:Nucleolar protein 10 n=1 Tax=Polyplax serrata TaxID=468196 RepID=A0AAN8S2A8_POLSC